MKHFSALLFVLFISNTIGGTLYGFSADMALISVDPWTGKQTNIGKPLPHEAQAQNLATIDQKSAIYYIVGFNLTTQKTQLIGVSLSNGKILSETNLPFEAEFLVGVGQTVDFDPITGTVLASGRDRSVEDAHRIIRMDPLSGQYSTIAVIEDIDVLGEPHVYDYINKVYWLQFGVNDSQGIHIDIFGYDTVTGKLLYQIRDVLNIETMSFDPKTGLIYGIGIIFDAEGKPIRILTTLDSKTGNTTIIGKIPNYFIINSSIAALDILNRILYCTLQPHESGKNDADFELVGVKLEDASIVSHPHLCQNPSLCPWSLDYFN